MVPLERESSNALFEVLEGWETILKAEEFTISQLQDEPFTVGDNDKHNSHLKGPRP